MAQLLRWGKKGRERLSAINHNANYKFAIAFPFYCILFYRIVLYLYVF